MTSARTVSAPPAGPRSRRPADDARAPATGPPRLASMPLPGARHPPPRRRPPAPGARPPLPRGPFPHHRPASVRRPAADQRAPATGSPRIPSEARVPAAPIRGVAARERIPGAERSGRRSARPPSDVAPHHGSRITDRRRRRKDPRRPAPDSRTGRDGRGAPVLAPPLGPVRFALCVQSNSPCICPIRGCLPGAAVVHPGDRRSGRRGHLRVPPTGRDRGFLARGSRAKLGQRPNGTT